MLFVLVIDVLNSRMMHAASSGILQSLTMRHAASSVSLYADDVVILCHPTQDNLQAIRDLLCVFSKASGMRTIFSKCSDTPIQCSPEVAEAASNTFAYPIAQFPITYLGLTLLVRKVPMSALLSLIDKLARKLSTWCGAMLSRRKVGHGPPRSQRNAHPQAHGNHPQQNPPLANQSHHP